MSQTQHHCHQEQHQEQHASCHPPTGKPDWLLWGSAGLITLFYFLALLPQETLEGVPYIPAMSDSVFSLINTMWWGIVLGILTISLLGRIPREFVMAALGTGRGVGGIVRATLAGVLLDLCSHGILMVGAKLYERGAHAGQVMAFLIASPWNSFSLTLVLVALIGLPWTLAFIGLSMGIAIVTGMVFDILVQRGVIAPNAASFDLPGNFRFREEAMKGLRGLQVTPAWISTMLRDGLKESRMVLRWIFFGVVLASLVRTFMPTDMFQTWFGPTLVGLGLTVVVATILEVCSEGSAPIAADLLTRAAAPGNSFTFLMTGVSTDYTEIMVLREATGRWKTALFLPLVTVPQVIAIGYLLNMLA